MALHQACSTAVRPRPSTSYPKMTRLALGTSGACRKRPALAQKQPACNNFFVFLGKRRRRKKSVSRNTISFWLPFAVNEAYGLSLDPNQAAVRVKAHELRIIRTSLFLKKIFAVQQVLRAGMWKSQNLFTSFCLRDVTHRFMNTFSIRPMVATQQVL